MPATNTTPTNNPAPEDWSKFGPSDFAVDLESIRQQLQNEDGMTDLIALLLNMLGRHDEQWQRQVDDLNEKSKTTMKAMIVMGKAMDHEKRRRIALEKSLAGLQHAAKPHARTDPVDPAASALAKGGLERAAVVGRLADQAVKMFGVRGGMTVKYDPSVAADMVIKGQMTSTQQRVWKRTGRVPDGIKII